MKQWFLDKVVNPMMSGSYEPKTRKLTGVPAWLYYGLAVFLSAFYLYLAGPPWLGSPGTAWRRGLLLLIVLVLIFARFPATKRSPLDRITLWDGALIIATVATFGYWILAFDDMLWRRGNPTTGDIVFGALAIVLSLEACRRMLGNTLVVVTLAFLLYTYAGPYMPGLLHHPGYEWWEIAYQMFTMDAIFGIVLDTTARFVVLFVVFSGLMKVMRAGDFFVEFPYALTAGFRGGPGKAAVVASGLFGMISGSVAANTAATGAFTIPLMKRAGFKPHIAGAIEPAASVGGMFMPPVMGAAVFLMSELIRVPYVHIVKVALAPAIIYFFSVGVMVHLEALKENIPLLPAHERENPWVLLKRGWIYLLPVGVILYLLLKGYTPGRAIYWSVAFMVALYLITNVTSAIQNKGSVVKAVGKTVADLGNGLADAANDVLTIGAIIGPAGIILGAISLTGLGFVVTTSIFKLTFGLLPLAILLAYISAYILGMGMTVTSSYILLATLVAPALIRMGVDPLPAHFLVFWYSQTSNVSPPVCLAAFVGAGIAQANPFRTGFAALRFSAFLAILPLAFIYTPILMPEGLTWDAARSMITVFLSTIPFGAAITGYWLGPLKIGSRALLLLVTLLLVIPTGTTDLLGIMLGAAFLYFHWRQTTGRVRVEEPSRPIHA